MSADNSDKALCSQSAASILTTICKVFGLVGCILFMSCRSAEHSEAVSFCKVLEQNQTQLANIDEAEAEGQAIVEVANWAGQVAFWGGNGEKLANKSAR